MHWRNTPRGYGWVTIVLHWTGAVLLGVLLPLGLWMTGLDYYDPWYRRAPDLHRSLGALFGLLLVLRIAVRLGERPPAPIEPTDWQRRAAGLTHLAMYLLPAALVVSGYLISTADGRPLAVFDWFEVAATLHGIEGQADVAGEIHFALAMLLLAVVAIHVLAVAYHQFILRDATLRRMLRPDRESGSKGESR